MYFELDGYLRKQGMVGFAWRKHLPRSAIDSSLSIREWWKMDTGFTTSNKMNAQVRETEDSLTRINSV